MSIVRILKRLQYGFRQNGIVPISTKWHSTDIENDTVRISKKGRTVIDDNREQLVFNSMVSDSGYKVR